MDGKMFASINKVNLSYTWKIKYEELEKQSVGGRLMRDFLVDYFDFKWRLAIYPKGVINTSSENDTGLFIYLMGSKQFPITADISFYILNSEGAKCNEYSFKRSFNASEGGGTHNFILFNNLLNGNFIVNNNLTLVYHISAEIPHVDTANEYMSFIDNLSKDFQKIMKDPNLSDITLIVCGQKFTAHKIILSARSPVFAALFNADMKENIQNEINISDVEVDVFKEMLRFIYTGKLKNLDKLAFELFTLSDKYELDELKDICGSFLYDNLTVDNAIDIFALFDRHSAIELKNKVLDFIVSNMKPIVNSERFKTFEKTHPFLAIEILRTAVTR